MQADLLDVLTRLASASNIRCMRVTPPFDGLDQFDYGLRKALDPYFDWQEFGSLLLQSTPPNTLLFAEDTFELQFALFRIPDEENAVFMIGPWATAERSENPAAGHAVTLVRKAMTLYRATITGCGFCRTAVSRLPSWQLFP